MPLDCQNFTKTIRRLVKRSSPGVRILISVLDDSLFVNRCFVLAKIFINLYMLPTSTSTMATKRVQIDQLCACASLSWNLCGGGLIESKFRTEILSNIYVLSATCQVCLGIVEMNALEKYLGFSCPIERFWAFNRLEITTSSSIICGLAYKRLRKRNCAVVKYCTNNTWMFAMVKFFIKYQPSSVEEPTFLAIAHPILCINYNPKVHFTRVAHFSFKEIVLLNVQDICTNCLYISLNVAAEGRQEDFMAYVCEFPNKKERD